VDPSAGLDGCGKSRPHRNSNPPQYSLVESRYANYANYAILAPKFVLQAIMRKCTRDLTAVAIMWRVRGPTTTLSPCFLLVQAIFEPNLFPYKYSNIFKLSHSSCLSAYEWPMQYTKTGSRIDLGP